VSVNRPAGATPEPSASDPAATPPDPVGLTVDELEVIRRVRDSLRSIRFGTVLIVVQDGKVVQIEMAEKIRLR
jgi:hypothetical protein